MDEALLKTYYESPCGPMEICASDKGITSVLFVNKMLAKQQGSDVLTDCVIQLDEYFRKKRTVFAIPLDLRGTNFQRSVWDELLNIPFGKTISYLKLATTLGDKKSIRAVGGANGKNPVSIIIPCHRVIGANGDLVGYSGGMDKKRWLLAHEGSLVQQELFL